MKRLTRRDFMRASALSMGAMVVSTGLSGCGGGSSSRRSATMATPSSEAGGEPPEVDRQVAFLHGIASGDPLADAVILWTRVTPEDDNTAPVLVTWQVARDPDFTQLVNEDSAEARAAYDFTLKVDVRGLEPGTSYYYRFLAAGESSPVGRTCTLPEGDVEQVTFAVMSCANYPMGYFHVYAEAAKEEQLDAVVHLGDYLYEFSSDNYDPKEEQQAIYRREAERMGRVFPENNDLEILTLVDYRRRYAAYRSDPGLLALHAKVPFISVWDDHEVANDAWTYGALRHDPATQEEYLIRKRHALQAYFEWMPIRPYQENNQEIIYRSFHYGDLVSLHMLDTRHIGRDEPLALGYSDFMTDDGQLDAEAAHAFINDPNRHLIGTTQLNWLGDALATSNATWQVLGQQVLMGRMTVPATILTGLSEAEESRDPGRIMAAAGTSLARNMAFKQFEGDPLASAAIEALFGSSAKLPYNPDAWDGYAAERDEVLNLAETLGKNLVVLAGDSHNAWSSELTLGSGKQKRCVGVEFATPSITSPGLNEYMKLPESEIRVAEEGFVYLIDDLKYANLSHQGYMRVTFTAQEARSEWRFVSSVKEREYQVEERLARTMVVQAGKPALMREN